jgi:hypothetical protein
MPCSTKAELVRQVSQGGFLIAEDRSRKLRLSARACDAPRKTVAVFPGKNGERFSSER